MKYRLSNDIIIKEEKWTQRAVKENRKE